MKNIFIGMLLVFLNFNLDIGASRIGLIPSFLGYIFMANGLSQLTAYSGQFVKVRPYATVMAVYSGILYAMDLLGISSALGEPVTFILGLASTLVSLYISHGIIMGIKDIEISRTQALNSEQLYSAWKLLAIFSLVSFLFYIVPALALICVIASFIVGIYYLVIFNKTKKLFYEMDPTL